MSIAALPARWRRANPDAFFLASHRAMGRCLVVKQIEQLDMLMSGTS
jgi:hypothetical protein